MSLSLENATEAELIKQRGSIKSKLTLFKKHLSKVNEPTAEDLTDLQLRVDNIVSQYGIFDQIQQKLESLASDELAEARLQERADFEDVFFRSRAKAEGLLKAAQTASSAQGASTQAPFPLTSLDTNLSSNHTFNDIHVKIPTMQLPKFSGTCEAWPSFADAFKSAVDDNPNFRDVHKLTYLRSCLTGRAAEKIESLETTSANYSVAWNILKNHYNDPLAIINNRIKAYVNMPASTKQSSESLTNLADSAEKHYSALLALNRPFLEAFPIYLLTSKMDEHTRMLWQDKTQGGDLPTMREVLDFLHKRARVIETTKTAWNDTSAEKSNRTNQSRQSPRFVNRKPTTRGDGPGESSQLHVAQVRAFCHLCKGPHFTTACEKLVKASVNERIKIVKSAGLCYNCLRSNHSTNSCMSGHCKKCNQKHHTLLHIDENASANPSHCNSVSANTISTSHGILSTAVIHMLDRENKPHACRVLLDPGAQSHFLTEKFADKLRLAKKQTNIPVSCVNNVGTVVKASVTTSIQSRHNKYSATVDFLLLPRVTAPLPSQQLPINHIPIPPHVKLADPRFNIPAEIDAIIGVGLFYNLLRVGQLSLLDGSIILQNTQLGWIVANNDNAQKTRSPSSTICNLATADIQDQIAKFWTIEQGPEEKVISVEERACEDHYKDHTQRDNSTGRYIVRLPFRDNADELGESYSTALKRFHSVERSLSRKPEIKAQYAAFMKEYRELGHMSEIETPSTGEGYYLPHHAVIKESSLTTKLRVVFDGSAKTSSGLSLNQILMVGPTIQDDLFSILIRFRSHTYVLTADIAKMYRQIEVDARDRNFQKILWREDKHEPIKTYQLNTVTYGTSPASFLATRTLQQLADDEAKQFPKASLILREDFYVDDLLTGAQTLCEAKRIRDELIGITRKAGLHLRQWASNDIRLIENLGECTDNTLISLDLSSTIKTLGINWNAKQDIISYTVKKTQSPDRITKRTILSEIAQLFDPLGLLGPVVIRAKLIMQRLWQLESHWDESVPLDVHTAWQTFRNELPLLEELSFQRKLLGDNHIVELHGFCDASERAYGACIYARAIDNDGTVSVQLICAKSRVAPLKTQTLPRLELCAALLLARLYKLVTNALRRIRFHRAVFWSDSTITLHWINTAPHTLKTFVSHRVSEIREIAPPNHWRHVRSEQNPADLISRGITPAEFIKNSNWRNGPTWLHKSEEHWPLDILDNVEIPERKETVILTAQLTDDDLLRKYSSLKRLKRVMAYSLRFIHNTRHNDKRTGNLSVAEIDEALTRVMKLTQSQSFADTIKTISSEKPLKSNIVTLDPFLDSEGVLRVGGRLSKSDLPYDQKHPILIPKDHHVSELIIRENHNRIFHGGAQATLNAVRERFWLVNGRGVIKRILSGCVTCRRARPVVPTYKMSDLPASRTQWQRPFLHCGVDYCGPIFIKEKRHRNRNRVKVYIAVFVCFVTKAVHIEVVSDLSTEAFLAALRRFISRRGKCSDMYSDNATNFVGADRELKSLINAQDRNDVIQRKLADEGITWHFIPPRSPHFGGLWEAAVKSLKHHMLRVIGDTLLTYEALQTYVIEIEAILNSRPITPLSADPNDLQALTPGHFLIGDSLTNIPEHDYRNIPAGRLSCWQHIQQMKQHFWTRWRQEYLHELTVRKKWHTGQADDIAIDTVVILHDDNCPPIRWTLGRIIDTHPGADGVIRVATVKTAAGTYKRSIKKLSPLFMPHSNNVDYHYVSS